MAAKKPSPRTALDKRVKPLNPAVMRRLAAVVMGSNDAVILTDVRGEITAWNRGAEHMYGWSEEEARRMNLRDLTPPERSAEFAELVRRLGAGETITPFDTLRLTKDGRVVDVSLTATLLMDESGSAEAIALTERDITPARQAQEELRRAAVELERSNQELRDFVYVASHDLQEPLRAVNGFLKLLEERYADRLDDKAREFIGHSVGGAARMSQLLSDLLALSRVDREPKVLQPVDAGAALAAAWSHLQSGGQGTSVAFTHDALPVVSADRAQLIQLFEHVIGNAVKFCHADRECRVHVSAEKRDSEWLFSIRDNGIGIDPRYFDRIFLIFQRLHTRRKYPGTGIGLAISKKIVERHGGRIWLESKVGEGSAFFFTLPAVAVA